MTDAAAARPRHRAVAGSEPPPSASGVGALEPGPIAVLPHDDAVVAAVLGAGGEVRPLDDVTRGLVWTAASGAGDLDAVLAAHPHIAWVQLPWAGVDAFADVLRRHRDDGRTWTSAKGAYAQPVAEHALMLALAVLREVPHRVRANRWEVDERGRTLFGAEVVVVGAGGIATELLRLLAPFDVRTTVVRRRDEPVADATRTMTEAGLGDALARADVVFVAAALTEVRATDARRRSTTVGPHRDEVAMWVSGRPARTHASQGEQRSLALALRLAAHRLVTERTGSAPVLVLDDVLSELDDHRATALLSHLPTGQIVMTTATEIPAAARVDRILRIAGGIVVDDTGG